MHSHVLASLNWWGTRTKYFQKSSLSSSNSVQDADHRHLSIGVGCSHEGTLCMWAMDGALLSPSNKLSRTPCQKTHSPILPFICQDESELCPHGQPHILLLQQLPRGPQCPRNCATLLWISGLIALTRSCFSLLLTCWESKTSKQTFRGSIFPWVGTQLGLSIASLRPVGQSPHRHVRPLVQEVTSILWHHLPPWRSHYSTRSAGQPYGQLCILLWSSRCFTGKDQCRSPKSYRCEYTDDHTCKVACFYIFTSIYHLPLSKCLLIDFPDRPQNI